ncbi:MAG: hypothetical protein KJ964_02690 [Verrucomicrobia bacterium]|nr:hypothetical protein [Verrucomicrobiota bacterium]MBU1735261.1 hypothetical protein [Verrucomicrobiota bacterium]MBU1856476.1 hypothetical protein [Verrucomicrobiota bacterium]
MEILAWIKDFAKRQPLKIMGVIIVALVSLATMNLVLLKLFPALDTPLWFPISLSSDPALNISGLPYAFLFLIVLYWMVKERGLCRGLFATWMFGLVLIILGNLIQGNVDIAFRQPLYGSIVPFQYYDDALKIYSWREWLNAFNAHQTELFVHSKTHPPFAVLLHYLVIQFLGNHPLRVAGVFILISSLSIVLMGFIFNELGLERKNRNGLVILFSVIPAINIYTAVSLDGVILTTCVLYLLGLIILVHRPNFAMSGMLLLVSGIILTNLLTFVGIFLFAVGALVGVMEYIFKRKPGVLIATGVAMGLFGLLIYGLNQFGHYNHIQAFFTAAHVENPLGFQGLTRPLNYVVTRVECVSELALFFSIGCLAVLFRKDRLQLSFWANGDDVVRIALAAIVTLGGMFVAGLNHTGETARSCLYIYPFLLLMFYKSDIFLIRDLIVLAGLQTVLMQLCCYYFW